MRLDQILGSGKNVRTFTKNNIILEYYFTQLFIRVLYWLAVLGVGGYFTLTGLVHVIQDYWRYPSVTRDAIQY